MKNKKVVWIIIGIVSIALIALAITYAYWQITKTQTGENEITTACLDITLVDAEEGNTGISLTSQYPLSDTEGAELTPYTFTVTNNCNTEVDYQIALESIGDVSTSISQGAIKVMLDSNTAALLNTKTSVTPTISSAYASNVLMVGTLKATGETGSSASHELRLWIDENAPVSENNKTFSGKISVTIGQGIEGNPFEEGTIAYNLLETAGGVSAVTELDSTIFATATIESDAGMYKAEDDYGDSYYYRGNVTNNYVKFGMWQDDATFSDPWTGTSYSVSAGESMYWRIVRINGDGTIRLIYAGTSKVANGESNPSLIDYKYYNSIGIIETKMYVGYMYGTADDPYGDDASTTLTDSIIKDTFDTWYETNLKTNYESYIADSIFCNDREEYSTEGDYAVYKTSNRLSTNTPVLTCSKQRDRFTVDDTTLGNGHLTNPVGLLTADEAVMAGYSWEKETINNYLDNKSYFWTSSPERSYGADTYMNYVSSGKLTYDGVGDYSGYGGVRPVINLKADVEFTMDSDGTYVITTN